MSSYRYTRDIPVVDASQVSLDVIIPFGILSYDLCRTAGN